LKRASSPFVETAAGHVGNLGGAPRALVEFRSGGAAVDFGPDQLGVAARAIVLAGHLLNSFVRNSESRRERLFSRDTNKNASKPDGCGEFLRVFSTHHELKSHKLLSSIVADTNRNTNKQTCRISWQK